MKLRKPAGFFFISLLIALFALAGAFGTPASARQAETPTVTPRPDTVYITVTYEEPINVRGGPNSVYYPVVGSLPVGAVAQAVGRSLAGEWVKIVFPEANDGSGVGWVYAPLVTISPGFLPVVEPPPTAAPAVVPTLDPDFVASLQPPPTATRPPTFTAPPPLVVPTYENPVGGDGGISTGVVVILLGGIGLAGLFIASLRRTR
ncbi:MAG: SH3 domain-containing protein [Chloroflexi bacterium]|nr:SH3 domain-containing protein [Chloroflexota bacterium]